MPGLRTGNTEHGKILHLSHNFMLEQKYFNGGPPSTLLTTRQPINKFGLLIKTQELPPQIRRTRVMIL